MKRAVSLACNYTAQVLLVLFLEVTLVVWYADMLYVYFLYHRIFK